MEKSKPKFVSYAFWKKRDVSYSTAIWLRLSRGEMIGVKSLIDKDWVGGFTLGSI
jgi:hypothetical protein